MKRILLCATISFVIASCAGVDGQSCDVIVMAAAITDFRPREQYAEKIKGARALSAIELLENDDILLDLAHTAPGKFRVGFAAETQDLEANAREKRREKRLDLIVANDVSGTATGFGSDENEVLFIDRNDRVEKISKRSKDEIAASILNKVATMLDERPADAIGGQSEDLVV